MTKPLRIVLRSVAILLTAASALAMIAAGCVVGAMGVVWFQEGRLLFEDQQFMVRGLAWLLASTIFVFASWRVANAGVQREKTEPPVVRRQEAEQKIFLIFLLAVLTFWLWGAVSGPAILKAAAVVVWVCVAYLAAHLHICLHEAGHLLAAWALRFDLRKLQVGTGPRLFCRSFRNGFQFEWRVWPQGGIAFANNLSTRWFRARHSLFILGGPVVDLGLVFVGYKLTLGGWLDPAVAETPAGTVIVLFFGWAAMALLGGIAPREVWIGDRKLWTDGYWLWTLWTGSNQQIVDLARKAEAQNFFETRWPRHDQSLFAFDRPTPGRTRVEKVQSFQEHHLRLRSRLRPGGAD